MFFWGKYQWGVDSHVVTLGDLSDNLRALNDTDCLPSKASGYQMLRFKPREKSLMSWCKLWKWKLQGCHPRKVLASDCLISGEKTASQVLSCESWNVFEYQSRVWFEIRSVSIYLLLIYSQDSQRDLSLLLSAAQVVSCSRIPSQWTHVFWIVKLFPLFCSSVLLDRRASSTVLWVSTIHWISTLKQYNEFQQEQAVQWIISWCNWQWTRNWQFGPWKFCKFAINQSTLSF